jgi:bacterioferritin (cytochrome b1)
MKDSTDSNWIKVKMVEKLNEVLEHERCHFEFYQFAGFIIKGLERVYLKPLLDKEMMSELEHVKMFAEKIVSLGGNPVRTASKWFISHTATARDILKTAIRLEREVLKLYHNLYPDAEQYDELLGDKSIILLLEENIEHTTEDVEEMEKILLGMSEE